MASAKRLIVGLGNPGSAYDGTRHNIGFEVADAVAARIRAEFAPEGAHAFAAWGRWRGRPLGVAKPITFMNRSGWAIRDLCRRYQLDLRDILVVVDDLNLPVGAVRLRPKGSAGGHNGTQDIIDTMGRDDFPRIRVGVGDDFGRGQQVRYVLAPFGAKEREIMDETVIHCRDAALTFVTDGLTTAMNRYNRKGG